MLLFRRAKSKAAPVSDPNAAPEAGSPEPEPSNPAAADTALSETAVTDAALPGAALAGASLPEVAASLSAVQHAPPPPLAPEAAGGADAGSAPASSAAASSAAALERSPAPPSPPVAEPPRPRLVPPAFLVTQFAPASDFDLAPRSTPAPDRSVAVRPAPKEEVREPVLPDESAGPAEIETGGVFTIDLAAIVKNWKALAQRVVPADCAAVVKADAYGCGVEQVVPALFKAGCRTFFVASLAEARQVRVTAPQATVYVLNGFAPGSAATFAEINAHPVIGSLAEFVEWDAFRRASGWNGGAALHFDTGMNRLGMPIEAVDAFTARLKIPDHGIALVMSHLACADTPEHPLNAKQIAAFRDLRFMFRGTATSLANSSGIFLGAPAHCDMVRPGAALYGINPTPKTQNLMEPVVTLKSRIAQVREVERGGSVGYGATWTAKRQARIAIVATGYGDGYPRAAGGPKTQAHAIIANRRCPMVGRISMDLMAFDATELPDELVKRGDLATLIGQGIGLDDVARWSDTIGYEILTAIRHRHRRIWKR